MKRLQRQIVRWKDDLRYSQFPREILGAANFARSLLPGKKAKRLMQAVQAYRFGQLKPIRGAALRRIQKNAEGRMWRDEKIDWSRFAGTLRKPGLTRSVILKAPGENGEKGAMLLTFEYNWLRLLAGISDITALEERYDIVFSTSSSPSAYALLGLALQSLKGRVFVQSCNFGEIADMEAIHPRIRCLPMMPCDWIDPALYEPLPRSPRDIDFLMVAGWAPVKRQWQFYQALKDMPRDLRVVMIGQAEGPYDIEHARRQSRLFGARQDIEFHQSMLIEDVAKHQARAKTSLIFSRREGCCVAVTESFFADTPVGLLSDAHIGPLAYINDKTGLRLNRKGDLSRELMSFLDKSDDFSAREWAEKNISNEVSAEKLNSLLRENAEHEGRPWTKDILTPCWRPHPTIRHNPEAESLRHCYVDLHHRYPDVFPVNLLEESYR
jgi:hypothetical protein